jgi:REP element-mobilizing transposase RayT
MRRYPESKNSLRKPDHDYRLPGYYMVTINTYQKQPLFGEINQGQLIPTQLGLMTQKIWHEIPQHEPTVKLDAFILMPDHLHGIIQITGNAYDVLGMPETQQFQPESHSLSIIIRNFKAGVTRTANRTLQTPPIRIWQTSFHDRIIHDEQGLEAARWYIRNNPANWWKEQGKSKR